MTQPASQSAPEVSIIIAAYNAQDFIETSINAALAQSNVALEVIVVDDASPSTLETAVSTAAKHDPRVKYHRLAKNGGPAAARNAALKIATGEFIAVLDADDTMATSRLRVMLDFAAENASDVVVDNMISRVIGTDPIEEYPFLDFARISLPMTVTLDQYIDPDDASAVGAKLGYLKPIIRRSFLAKNQIIYDEALRNSEDFYLIADILMAGGRMHLIELSGYIYSVREGSISHRLSPEMAVAVVAKERAFQKQYWARLGQHTRSLARQRLNALEQQSAFETLAAKMKARSLPGTMRAFLGQPKHVPFIIRRLAGIAADKFNRGH